LRFDSLAGEELERSFEESCDGLGLLVAVQLAPDWP